MEVVNTKISIIIVGVCILTATGYVALGKGKNSKDANVAATRVPEKNMHVKLAMSHGPMKDGLAAFLICGQNQFRVGEPITIMLGIAYLKQSKVQMSVWLPRPVREGFTSRLSINEPDGKEISHIVGHANYFIPDPNKYTAHLRVGQFVGRYESLRKYHDFIKPGLYTIKWNYRAHPAKFWWQGELVSNEIQIEILPVDNSELEALSKTLLETDPFEEDPGLRYGYRLNSDEPRVRAIDQLRSAASPEAVGILQEFLTTHGRNHKLKRYALVTLGRTGTKPAIEAIKQFETWSNKRFKEPPPFQFGFKDHAIDHFVPHDLLPLATTTNEENKTWAIFQWKRHSPVAETWICKSTGEDLWTQPILLDFPGMPEFSPYVKRNWNEKCEFQIKADLIKIVIDGQIMESRINDHLVDSDKDGVPDPVEAHLLTNPKDPDSDKDGLPDGKDCNPLTPKHTKTDDVTEIRQAVFSALCATSNSQDAIVIVKRGDFAEQEYYGYGGCVLRSPQTRNGFINITDIRVKIESPTTATAGISDWEGNLAASVHEAKLKKLHGKWVIVEFKMTLIS